MQYKYNLEEIDDMRELIRATYNVEKGHNLTNESLEMRLRTYMDYGVRKDELKEKLDKSLKTTDVKVLTVKSRFIE